jgi:uncharacterized protein YlxW (UPF0749 family)
VTTATTRGESREETRDAPLPDRVTLPLLTLVTRESLDQDYVHAAERRARREGAPTGADEPPARTSLRGAAVVTAVFGLMIALAAVQTARNADVDQASRAALVERIDARKADVRDLEARIDELGGQLDELRSSAARVRGQQAQQAVSLRALQISTGAVAVEGPGLRVTVSDNPDGSDDGRVRSADLRRLVNGLWGAGAEAVAVNGRRLTTLSAITQAGIAVQVNRGPLSPPYVVSAIGTDGLEQRLDATGSGQVFLALAEQFGFEVERQQEDELRLPAASANLLRVQVAERPSGTQGDQQPTGEDAS